MLFGNLWLLFLICYPYRVWCVRFNPFHDQLLLSASSDARVLLSSAASVSSEYGNDLNINEELETKQMFVMLSICFSFLVIES